MIFRTRRSIVVKRRAKQASELILFRWGFHLRVHRGSYWWHLRAVGFQRSTNPIGKGTLAWEIAVWRTSPTPTLYRIGVKAFIRFKVGFGGEPSEEYHEARTAKRDRRGYRPSDDPHYERPLPEWMEWERWKQERGPKPPCLIAPQPATAQAVAPKCPAAEPATEEE